MKNFDAVFTTFPLMLVGLNCVIANSNVTVSGPGSLAIRYLGVGDFKNATANRFLNSLAISISSRSVTPASISINARSFVTGCKYAKLTGAM
jgi:hypothetical protein